MLSTITSILFINPTILHTNSTSTLNSITLTHNLSWLWRIPHPQSAAWHVETCRESSWPHGCDFSKGLDVVNLKTVHNWWFASNELATTESCFIFHSLIGYAILSITFWKISKSLYSNALRRDNPKLNLTLLPLHFLLTSSFISSLLFSLLYIM